MVRGRGTLGWWGREGAYKAGCYQAGASILDPGHVMEIREKTIEDRIQGLTWIRYNV